ncbi:MAG: hypothetical protein KTR14_07055 [Vampirovibrio sp.]|nr:hypothetical protein [Vampirovibrio sp.]
MTFGWTVFWILACFPAIAGLLWTDHRVMKAQKALEDIQRTKVPVLRQKARELKTLKRTLRDVEAKTDFNPLSKHKKLHAFLWILKRFAESGEGSENLKRNGNSPTLLLTSDSQA